MSARVLVITGVAGSGKSTVGRALAARLGWRFQDADDLHTAESIDRMHRGLPLDDAMRQPWLERVRAVIEDAIRTGASVVVACSALKQRYRDFLSVGSPTVHFVFLDASRELLQERLAARQQHFAGTSLLESQLDTLERPQDALALDASKPVDELVDAIIASLPR